MTLSLGSGLTEELLLLVREDCGPSLLSSPLSVFQLPPPLVPLKQHPHFSSAPNSLLLLFHHPHISSYFHLFVCLCQYKLSEPNRGQTGYSPCSGGGFRTELPRLFKHIHIYLHTHTHKHMHAQDWIIFPSIYAFYVSVTVIYWLAGFYYINNNLPLKSDRETERWREGDRGGVEEGQEGGRGIT